MLSWAAHAMPHAIDQHAAPVHQHVQDHAKQADFPSLNNFAVAHYVTSTKNNAFGAGGRGVVSSPDFRTFVRGVLAV